MKEAVSRRTVLGAAAGATAVGVLVPRWVFAANPTGGVQVVEGDGSTWQPLLFDAEQAEVIARLAEIILPRTDTPGARDARVHEYLDLRLSLAEAQERDGFLEGYRWFEKHARKTLKTDLHELDDSQLTQLLRSIGDEHDELPKKLRPGGPFFADLKRWTLFGFYTSRVGRVEELGLSDVVSMETFRGCRHRDGSHA